jgi:hypothetical protein
MQIPLCPMEKPCAIRSRSQAKSAGHLMQGDLAFPQVLGGNCRNGERYTGNGEATAAPQSDGKGPPTAWLLDLASSGQPRCPPRAAGRAMEVDGMLAIAPFCSLSAGQQFVKALVFRCRRVAGLHTTRAATTMIRRA